MKDKDTFAQKLSKERNKYESEVVVLKKIIDKLQNAKVEQLDVDTETGLIFVRNAQERENKVIRQYDEYKEDTKGLVDKINVVEQEKEDFKSKFEFLKNKMGKSLRENQDVLTCMDLEIDDLKNNLLNMKVKSEIKES